MSQIDYMPYSESLTASQDDKTCKYHGNLINGHNTSYHKNFLLVDKMDMVMFANLISFVMLEKDYF